MLPDYGLEAPDDEQFGEGFHDENEDEDTFNDDTFGSVGEWQQGNEAALEMSRLHEAFLSGELELPPSEAPAEYTPNVNDSFDLLGGTDQSPAGFFGDLTSLGTLGGDFLLEDEPSFDILPNLDEDVPLSLDAHTESLLESPSKQTPPLAAPGASAAAHNRGLRVAGLPRNLDETQTKQLLTHFGPLAHFQLQRGTTSNSALLSYQDASVTDSACASLHGIPLGASTLEVTVVDMAQAISTLSSAPQPPARPAQADLLSMLQRSGGGAPAPPPLASAVDVAALEAKMVNSSISAPPPALQQKQQPAQHPAPALTPSPAQLPTIAPGPLPARAMPGQPHAQAPLIQPHLQPQPQPNVARGPPPVPAPGPLAGGPPPAQLAHVQAMAAHMPPQFRAAMAQMAHLPTAQQQAFLTQVLSHQSRMQQQMASINQRPLPLPGQPGQLPMPLRGQPPQHAPPPPRAPSAEGPQRNPQLPHRVGKRMMGSELQLVMRHQALQLQINDPISDDFYHHFWVVKGGQSRAKGLQTRPAVISTERKKMDDERVSASLGLGAVFHRTPDVAVRTPRKLLEVPSAAGETPSSAGSGGAAPGVNTAADLSSESTVSTSPPLGASRWVFRQLVDTARDTLIELRVHASSPAVMTPQGQQTRVELLQKLHAIVRGGSAEGPVNVELLNHEKGRKLLVDLLPLWPTAVQSACLLSLLEQLPECLRTQVLPLADVPALATCLASLPKALPLEHAAKLLEATVTHGAKVLKQALERSDVTALLLGLLCCPGMAEASPGALQDFYAALLPLAATSETPWALLNALLPVANAAHAGMLQRATAAVQADIMAENCKAAHAAFVQRLQQHIASFASQ